jgi:hypothetical protein
LQPIPRSVSGSDGTWSASCIYKSELKQIEVQAVRSLIRVGVYLNEAGNPMQTGRRSSIPRKYGEIDDNGK